MLLKSLAILFLSSHAGAGTAELRSQADGFFSISRLSAGQYRVQNGPTTCQAGALRTEVNTAEDFTLMLGGHGLILGLGRPPELIDHEGKCQLKFESAYFENKAWGSIADTCDQSFRWVEVRVTEFGFTYTRIVFEKGVQELYETCDLIRSDELAD
jgi:hypothetical protein